MITHPLNNLTKKEVPFEWGLEQKVAFELLKQQITSSPILAQPDPLEPY